MKDRSVYSELLRSAYDAISRQTAFNEALKTFTDEIRNQTSRLSDKLNRALGMTSAISPPTDLGDLFESLDFETLVAGQDNMSLIRQRGDGIQARHIPEMLSFVAEKDEHQYHLLAIEEPENSLSVNSALRLGERIREIATGDQLQTFITTHSPTFYTLSGDQVKKFYLSRETSGDVRVLDGTQSTTEELLSFMGDSFYLPLIAKSVMEADKRASEIKADYEALQARLADQNRPLFFVEGPSDARLLTCVINLMGGRPTEFEVIGMEGTTHAERLAAMSRDMVAGLLRGRQAFVLLDSDKAGRLALPRAILPADAGRGWCRAANGLLWRTIPMSAEADAAFAAAGIIDLEGAGVTIEDLYTAQTRSEAVAARAYGLSKEREFIRTKADMLRVSDALRDDTHKFYLHSPADNLKGRFVDWLVEGGRYDNEDLRMIVQSAVALLP